MTTQSSKPPAEKSPLPYPTLETMVDAAVLAAAESHDQGAVLAWLDSGGFIDATFIWHGLPDMTLLGVAAATGGAGLVQSLLERGADVNLRNGRGRSALALSAHCFNSSILPSVPGAPHCIATQRFRLLASCFCAWGDITERGDAGKAPAKTEEKT